MDNIFSNNKKVNKNVALILFFFTALTSGSGLLMSFGERLLVVHPSHWLNADGNMASLLNLVFMILHESFIASRCKN